MSDYVTGNGVPSIGARGNKAQLVEHICNFIRSNASSDLSLEALESRFGLSRYSLQKIFREIMGITPRKYLEECRINLLKRNLREGEPLPNAVYKTGYNSQSWLYTDSKSKLGMLPSKYRNGGKGATIRFLTDKCELGHLLVAETDHGICTLSIADSEKELTDYLKREFPRADIIKSEEVRGRINSVIEYFDGQLLNLPVEVGGTEFQRRVWAAIKTIPYGETRTYNQIAEMVGKPKAYRAVANACGANPVPLIIPCHRVVRKDGTMGGYALGTHRKKSLLQMEKKYSHSGSEGQ